jgi:hypothetical protein
MVNPVERRNKDLLVCGTYLLRKSKACNSLTVYDLNAVATGDARLYPVAQH